MARFVKHEHNHFFWNRARNRLVRKSNAPFLAIFVQFEYNLSSSLFFFLQKCKWDVVFQKLLNIIFIAPISKLMKFITHLHFKGLDLCFFFCSTGSNGSDNSSRFLAFLMLIFVFGLAELLHQLLELPSLNLLCQTKLSWLIFLRV